MGDVNVSAFSSPRWRDRLNTALLVATGVGSAVLFLVGLLPGYVFELDGYMNATERCPAEVVSEQSYDAVCARELVARGPLYLGKGYLAASFALGAVAIGGIHVARRRSLIVTAAIPFFVLYVLIGGAAVFWSEAPGLVQGAYFLGIGVIGSIFVLARRSGHLGVAVLAIAYVAAWIGLLVWNAAEGARLLESGANMIS